MSTKSIDRLGELQREILETVWRLQEATVHQVRDELNKSRDLAYTTVLTAMQRLEKANLLQHQRKGKSHVYSATNTREKAGMRSVHQLISSVFGGNTLLMLQHLMADDSLSDEELTALRKMIDQKRREKKK